MEKNNDTVKPNKHYNIISTIAIIVLCILLWRGCEGEGETEKMYQALNDSLVKTRNSLGQEVSTRQIIEAANKKDFLAIRSKDSTIIALQKLVKNTKNVLAATVIKNQTYNSISGNTTVNGRDTIVSGDTIKIYPEYTLTRFNKWENISIKANKDSTHIEYKIYNDFNITQSLKKRGLFKPPVPEIQIVNLNPHTETLDVRSFEVKAPNHNKRYAIAGVIAGALATFLLMR